MNSKWDGSATNRCVVMGDREENTLAWSGCAVARETGGRREVSLSQQWHDRGIRGCPLGNDGGGEVLL